MWYIKDLKRLRSLFVEKGFLTLTSIAKQFDVSKNTVSNWFKGGGIQYGRAISIAQFLNQDVDDLFRRENGKED